MPPTVRPTDADTPLGGLPPAEPVLHAKHSLELVVVEIRYTGSTGTLSSEDVLALRDRLLEADVDLPAIEAVHNQEVAFEVGPTGPHTAVSSKEIGWQLASADGTVTAVVTSELVRVQTARRYIRWSESLAAPLSAILTAAHPVLQPQLVARIGVRFINRFTDPSATSPRSWVGRIEAPFLGPITDDVLGARLRGTQQQIDIDLGSAQGAIVRHGAFIDAAERGAMSYLLDIDVYNQTGLKADPEMIIEEATRLDRTAYTLFQQVTTPALRAQMEPYERETPDKSGQEPTP
jgi:uncharacterized protein (TIGR04255 family)